MKFAMAVDTRVGGRPYNEDRIGVVCTQQAQLLVLADGMGGHAHGEVAAQIAVDVFSELFKKAAKPKLQHPRRFLLNAGQESHQAILDHAIRHRMSEVPSTTLVVAVIQDGEAWVAHAGDSRCYLLRDGQVVWRTHDHSHVQRLIDTGFLNEADAHDHPARNRIYNCLGAIGEPDIELAETHALRHGDTLLLCSDGVWGPLRDDEIARSFAGRLPAMVVPALLSVADKRAGVHSDNLSAIALQLLSDEQFVPGRDGFIDSETLVDTQAEQTWQSTLMDSELTQGLPRG
ncbi:MAG: PP2C family protein-serine/threonine phosphatase [Vogesella sp.]|jgi:serine/threonine protein phosphatase PrpC|uniref:PP2C family protein-serine/threonine phosphatase n=1 Tax=Vogesella sp. TaxID=1904252 RepID=UPI003F31EE7E